MKLVIEIPEEVYNNAKNDMLFGSTLLVNAIKNGKPQEPKKGHWKKRINRATGHIETVCSECGAEEGYPYNDYCGNCGAKMFEPQETETWNGIHTQITAPKGTFDKLYNEAEEDEEV